MNKNYSITFWIKLTQNPTWKDPDSIIDFPSFIVNETIRTFFSKDKNLLKVFVLHPRIGYRKIVADVTAYLGNDAFIAFTNSEVESKLYINGALVSTVKPTDLSNELEIGDYVLVKINKGDLKTLTIEGESVQITMPAKVVSIQGDKVTLFFLGQNEILELNKDRLVY